MKKTTGFLALLLTVILICSLFAGCAKDNEADTDTQIDTSEATESGSDTENAAESESKTADTVAEPIEGLETVPEEIESKRLLYISTRASKFLRNNLYSENGASLSWYKFYNACVTGTVDVASDAAQNYINECLTFFEENGLDDEVEQANALLSAAKARS